MKQVMILGGVENTLSLVRNLSRRGISVAVSAEKVCAGLYSRYCRRSFRIPDDTAPDMFWGDLLFTRRALKGSVLLCCSDDAMLFVARNEERLRQDYLVEEFDPFLRVALLDKQETLRLAADAGVPTPASWAVTHQEDVRRIADAVSFPVILKPIHSHMFQKHYGKKLLEIEGRNQLLAKSEEVLEKGLDFMICELIPGPDELLSSYYTYLDEGGRSLFEYTKRVIRRYPVNFGGGVYHESVWLPETAEMGRKFFQAVGLRGLGNVEFKKDPRDGTLKIIECNARFTAAQELLVRSGIDIGYMIYQRLTGGEVPELTQNGKNNLRLWYPVRDFRAYRELSRSGSLNLKEWIGSVMRKQIFPYFSLSDPYPSFQKLVFLFESRLRRNSS